MMAKIRQWVAAFDALSVRERVLILVTVVVAILLPVYMYGVEPSQKQQLKLTTQVAKLKASNANKLLDIQTLISTKRSDPNEQLRQQIAELESQLDRINATLRERSQSLVSATDMLGRLEQVLSGYPGLTLVEVSKAKPRHFIAEGKEVTEVSDSEKQATSEQLDTGLYRHDLQVVVEGGFFDTLEYLQALEQMPQGFFWDSIDYQVLEYPRARISLEVHTLSTEQGWLGV